MMEKGDHVHVYVSMHECMHRLVHVSSFVWYFRMAEGIGNKGMCKISTVELKWSSLFD